MTAIFEMDASLLSAGPPSAQNSATQTEPARGADFMAALSNLSADPSEGIEPEFRARATDPTYAKLTSLPAETALPSAGQLDLTVTTDPTVQATATDSALERIIAAQTQGETAPQPVSSEVTRILAAPTGDGAAEPDPRQVLAASGETQSAAPDITVDLRRSATVADAPAPADRALAVATLDTDASRAPAAETGAVPVRSAEPAVPGTSVQTAASETIELKATPVAAQPLAAGQKPDLDLQPNRTANVTGDVQAQGSSVDAFAGRPSAPTIAGANAIDTTPLPGATPPSAQAEADLVQTQAGSDRAIPEGDLPAAPATKTANADSTAKAPSAFGSPMTADAGLTPDAVPTGTQSLAATPAAASAPAPITLTPTSAVAPNQIVLTAAPGDIPSVISQSLANEAERPDRIIVQLDPPELGRVSIDFKFDAQGLQHITISGESPEALRQLRLMHFELIQTLERQGLTGQDMSFKQHASSQHQQSNLAASTQPGDLETAAEAPSASVQPALHRSVLPTDLTAGGLDIRL